MTKKNLLKEAIKNLVNEEIDLEVIVKKYVKEIIYEHFGNRPWLSEIRIEHLSKEVLSNIFTNILKGEVLKFSVIGEIEKPEKSINYKVNCNICRQPMDIKDSEICNNCWKLNKYIDTLLKNNKSAGIIFLKNRIKEIK